MNDWMPLNAWCELRSPSQQVSKSQAGATELPIEPHTEVVQRHPRCQTSSQASQLVRSLSPEAEGVEQLVVDAFYDLADGGYPPPQALGPVPLAAVALGRVDDAHSIEIEPTPMVFFALEALVGHVGSRCRRPHARKSGVRSMPHSEEGLGYLLVGGRSGTEAKACDDARRICGHEQTEALVPSQAVGPSDVCVAGQPSFASALRIPDGHRRAVQGLVGTALSLHRCRQMQGHLLDEPHLGAHQSIELRALGQGRESVVQVGRCVAVKVPLTAEAAPSGEDSEGDNLARAERRIRSGKPLFLRLGVAEVVHHDVKCCEEGVLKSSMRSRFLSLRDRVASRL